LHKNDFYWAIKYDKILKSNKYTIFLNFDCLTACRIPDTLVVFETTFKIIHIFDEISLILVFSYKIIFFFNFFVMFIEYQNYFKYIFSPTFYIFSLTFLVHQNAILVRQNAFFVRQSDGSVFIKCKATWHYLKSVILSSFLLGVIIYFG
jgi:hypothetical protein